MFDGFEMVSVFGNHCSCVSIHCECFVLVDAGYGSSTDFGGVDLDDF